MGPRHARSLMSLRTIGWGDMLRSTCRSGRPARATLSSMRVALHTCVRRQIRTGMSPFTSSSSDMRGVERRPSRGSGATCEGWNVAPRADPERHARAGMSLRTRMKRDMDRVAASPDRSSKATFTLLLGAPRAWVGRHAAATSATCTGETVALPARQGPSRGAPGPEQRVYKTFCGTLVIHGHAHSVIGPLLQLPVGRQNGRGTTAGLFACRRSCSEPCRSPMRFAPQRRCGRLRPRPSWTWTWSLSWT
jgi:hypothetical protein